MEAARLICGDVLDVLPTLPADSADLIVVDPPYFKVKDRASCPWDHLWKTEAEYIAWMGRLCEQWRRVLKANGSLYVFASPKMADLVSVEMRKWFNVLNRITWRKKDLHDNRCPPYCGNDNQRSFVPFSEAILFAEHHGADNIAKGEAGYEAKCDELRGFVFEPLRAYLDGERKRAGIPHRTVIAHLGMGGHDTHFFSPVQWKLPLPEQYAAMQQLFNASCNGEGPQYLRREYEDLRREYEDLRREYEDLRRPFSVSADVPYTDVWDFPTVSHYPGKHPCEKPAPLLAHIVKASSRPGAVVLDCFAGSFALAVVCQNEGRQYIGIEADEKWIQRGQRRIRDAAPLFALAE